VKKKNVITRRTLKGVKPQSIKVSKVYPKLDTAKTIDTLKTIGIGMTRKETSDLISYLSKCLAQEFKEIHITVTRQPQKNKKELHQLTFMGESIKKG